MDIFFNFICVLKINNTHVANPIGQVMQKKYLTFPNWKIQLNLIFDLSQLSGKIFYFVQTILIILHHNICTHDSGNRKILTDTA